MSSDIWKLSKRHLFLCTQVDGVVAYKAQHGIGAEQTYGEGEHAYVDWPSPHGRPVDFVRVQ